MKQYICEECLGEYCLISLSGIPGEFQCLKICDVYNAGRAILLMGEVDDA